MRTANPVRYFANRTWHACDVMSNQRSSSHVSLYITGSPVRISQITKLAHGRGAQWLKWNIRGEATARQLWGPQLGGCGQDNTRHRRTAQDTAIHCKILQETRKTTVIYIWLLHIVVNWKFFYINICCFIILLVVT